MTIQANITGRQAAETVLDLAYGEAADFDQAGRFAFWNTIFHAARVKLPEPADGPQPPSTARRAEPMTDAQAAAFGRSKVPERFKKHAGQRVDDVPLSYLTYLAEHRDEWIETLRRYLASPRTQRETPDDAQDAL